MKFSWKTLSGRTGSSSGTPTLWLASQKALCTGSPEPAARHLQARQHAAGGMRPVSVPAPPSPAVRRPPCPRGRDQAVAPTSRLALRITGERARRDLNDLVTAAALVAEGPV